MLHSVKVRDYMSEALVTFAPDMDVMRAIHLLLENEITGAPVLDNLGNIVGVLSEKDCLRVGLGASYHEEWGGKVGEYMSRDPVTVEDGDNIVHVARMFLESPYKRYPVTNDENRLVGVISRRDVLRAIEALW